ncbi:MAG: tRNA preQ1(34) S-adenosylmethionine ribosyltransferase-isomerase QueA [Treponema sp.]|nr:tRNA preQ1(34) S-adenosylmethionine ribosyltransferase-isomerase QueA [Treponema sp.]
MRTDDFNFHLPQELIAQHPTAERGQSRLMLIDRKNQNQKHLMMHDLPSIVEPGTLMVFNNSRVRRARILGVSKEGGAKVEFLLLKRLDELRWQALAQKSKRRKSGSAYSFGDASCVVEQASEDGDGTLIIRFERAIDDAWLDVHGHVPLPPYIKRDGEDNALSEQDRERYQTVYAKEHGSAAAPTAGLHFTEELLSQLEKSGVETAFITLHVGIGTFLPVRSEKVEDHRMHEESYSINDETARRIEQAKAQGRKILAVGTTSVRALEAAWDASSGSLRKGDGNTSIFIYPGYQFKAVDIMFTNFHTPGSTLIMMIAAFAGKDFILKSYEEAVKEKYRFFSYGDACLIV